MQKSIIIMSNTVDKYDVIGESYRADSWYGYTDGIHTVSVTYSRLYGNFHLQGTLSVEPTENDWFDIGINSASSEQPYLVFNGESGISAFTFVGNFTFLRAVLGRSERNDLVPLNENAPVLKSKPGQGQIDKVILAM